MSIPTIHLVTALEANKDVSIEVVARLTSLTLALLITEISSSSFSVTADRTIVAITVPRSVLQQ